MPNNACKKPTMAVKISAIRQGRMMVCFFIKKRISPQTPVTVPAIKINIALKKCKLLIKSTIQFLRTLRAFVSFQIILLQGQNSGYAWHVYYSASHLYEQDVGTRFIASAFCVYVKSFWSEQTR